MWQGEYSFFDYKYNINYNGQDYDGPMRWVYTIFTLVSITILLILFRKTKKEHVATYMKILAIAMPILEITKITWESYWDIKTGRGFNKEGLIPIYTCSLFIYCCVLSAFGKGKIKDWCTKWLPTIGVVGGMSNVLFIQGLKWYPFFTFGAFYSMFFHYIMVFTGLFLVVTGYVKYKWIDILYSFIPHLAFSCLVIPIDYIFGWDYMQYYSAGGVPIITDLSDKFVADGCRFMTAIVMLAAYLILTAFFISIYIGIPKIVKLFKKK